MAVNVHITHWNDTEANVRSDADLLQAGIVGAGDSIEWGCMDSDATDLHYVNRYVDAATGAVTYKSIIFDDITAIGDLYTAEYHYHYGDTDTYDRWQSDQKTTVIGGVEFWNLVEGASDYCEFNSGEVDVDFIVNGSSANLLYCNAGDNSVGIGIDPTSGKLHVYDANAALVRIEAGADGYDSLVRFYQNGSIKASVGYEDTDDVLSIVSGSGGLGSSNGLKIDSSGRVGFNVIPETSWPSAYDSVIKIGDTGSISWSGTGFHYLNIMENAYGETDASTFKRIESGYASRYYQSAQLGDHYFQVAATDAADSAINGP